MYLWTTTTTAAIATTTTTTTPIQQPLFQDHVAKASTRKVKPVWIKMRQEMMGIWDAVASAGPYANNLHLTRKR